MPTNKTKKLIRTVKKSGTRYSHGIRTRKHDKIIEEYDKTIGSIKGRKSKSKDIITWVEANRYINGEKWSYQSSGPRIEYGEHDKRHKYMYRPYLPKYVNEKARLRSVIKPRQCLVGETVVYTKQNGHLTLETVSNLFKQRYRGDILYQVNGQYCRCNIIDIWESGEKDIIEISTSDGFKIECSLREKIWVPDKNNFVLAQDLCIGDRLCTYQDDFGETILPDGIPELIGYWVSDGTFHITAANRIIMYFRNRRKSYINEVDKLTNGHNRIQKCIDKQDGQVFWDVHLRQAHLFRELMREWGQLDKKHEYKRLPDIVMSVNRKQVAIILNRLFAGDGYYHKRLTPYSKFKTYAHEIGIGSMSYPMLIQIQILLNRFGIQSTIKNQKQKGQTKRFWKLMLSTKRSHVLRFMENIGIYDKITNQDIQIVKNEIDSIKFYPHRKEHRIKPSGTIISIKLKPFRQTYDISVSDKENHCFFANGILVSNSELTENQINENLYYAVTQRAKIAHIFPTDELGDAISNEKIAPAIKESPELQEELSGQGAVRRYSFRSGGIYTITGALKKAGGRASSRDILVFDEWDFMPGGIQGVYEELLSHSTLGLIRKISTPTVPGVGIDQAVKDGCEYEWWVKCPKCKKLQLLTWPDNLINFFDIANTSKDDPAYLKKLNQVYIGCKHCATYIDRNSLFYRKNSKWDAKRPELIKENASYYINAMMIPWKTGKELLRKYHNLNNYLWQWWNEVFGISFLKADNRLQEQEILSCEGEYAMVNSKLPVLRNISIGIDWGEKQSWVVVSANGLNLAYPERRQIVYLEEINEKTLQSNGYAGKTTDHVKRVIQIAKVFNTDIIINDANGIGIDRNKTIIDEFNDRAWGCFFDNKELKKQATSQSNLLIPHWAKESRKLTISKVHTIKEIQGEFRNRLVELPQIQGVPADVIYTFTRHQRALAIQPRWNTEYEREFEIAVKVMADDHFFDAHMYSKVGHDKLVGAGGVVGGLILNAI